MTSTALALSVPVDNNIETEVERGWKATTEALSELRDWLMTKETLESPMHKVEQAVCERGREVLRRALQAHLNARGRGDVGPAVRVKEEGQVLILSHRREADRQLRTVFGAVGVQRLAYSSPGQSSLCPVDAILQLPVRRYSYEVQRHFTREAARGPYGEAVKTLQEYTGIKASKRTIEEVVKDAAVDFEEFYRQRVLPSPEATSDIVVGAVDCKGICILQDEPVRHVAGAPVERRSGLKRMATVGTVYTVAPRPRTPEEVVESLFKDPPRLEAVGDKSSSQARAEHKRLWASLTTSKEAVIAEMAAEMERRDPAHTKKRAVVTDGERALQRHVTTLLPGVVLILDLLHVLERLWDVAIVFFGPHPSAKTQREGWVRKQTLRLLQGGASEVVRGIRQSVTKRDLKGKAKKEVLTAAAYLYRNRSRMRYDQYLKQGLPIASGAVEGACKNLINDRMERAGMRWLENSAEALLQIRALYLSGDFDTYWTFHIAREQARLRGNRTWQAVEK